ncbi:MAG: hypothetical protein WDO14_10220 [Bacteroidota bacterium]
MSQFRFKIKGYLNETGEYSELHNADSGTILQFILQHWFNESLPNNLDIVFIQNEAGDQLIIDHLKRDIFDYYFIEGGSARTYYHKKTDIQFMFFALESFFNNRNVDIRHNLTATTYDSKFIMGDFRGKDFNYKITNWRLWKNLDILIFPLIVMGGSILFSFVTSYVMIIVGGLFCTSYAFFMYSSLIRLRSYYNDNKDISIRFSRGDDFLHVKRGTWSRSIPKNEIRHVLKYIQPLNDGRTFTEFHTEIEFINGNVLNITTLLVPQHEIEVKFANDPIPIEFKVMEEKVIKRPTNLDKYFSAIKPLGASDPGGTA